MRTLILLFAFTLCGIATSAQVNSITVQNNLCTDMNVTVYFDDPTHDCANGYACVTSSVVNQTVPSGGNMVFTVPCNQEYAYRIFAQTFGTGTSANHYLTGCGADNGGNEDCGGNYQIYPLSPTDFEINN